MIFLLSPSKSQDFESQVSIKDFTQPIFKDEIQELVDELKKYPPDKLRKLMKISENLAALNYSRYQDFKKTFTPKNSKQAMFAFVGDVYRDIDAYNYSKKEIEFAQEHMRTLSGLYGLLRPLDLIQPYRLEMKTKLKTGKNKDLYQFWGNKIAEQMKDEDLIINLASNEYFKSINQKILTGKMVTPTFKEKRGSTYKIIALYAKYARGTMANFIIKNRITNPEHLKDFREDGYTFSQELSKGHQLVFIRSS